MANATGTVKYCIAGNYVAVIGNFVPNSSINTDICAGLPKPPYMTNIRVRCNTDGTWHDAYVHPNNAHMYMVETSGLDATNGYGFTAVYAI